MFCCYEFYVIFFNNFKQISFNEEVGYVKERRVPLHITFKSNEEISIKEKLNVLVEQSKLFEKNLGKVKSFAVMKKHFKAYISGFEGAKELRIKCMEVNNSKELAKIFKDYIKENNL